MITVIQAVSSSPAVSIPPALGPISNLVQEEGALQFIPGVIVTLGAGLPVPLTYNAAGLFASPLPVTNASQGTSGSIAAPAGTVTNPGMVTTANAVTDLVALLGLGDTASSGIPNAPVVSRSLLATVTQALTKLLTPDVNLPSSGGVDSITANQALARHLTIQPDSTATALDTIAAASDLSATGILQGLPPDSRVQALNSLLSTDLGLAAAVSSSSAGTASITKTISSGNDSTGISTPAKITTPTNADSTPTLASLLLANANLTTILTGAVSSIAGTTTNTDNVSSTIPAVAIAPAAAISATIAARPAIAAAVATAITSNTNTTAVAGNISDTSVAAGASAIKFLMDSDTQAQTNITWNPAYANAVAGLYVDMAISGSKQAQASALPDTTDSIQPVTAVPPVNAVSQYAG